MSVLLSCVFIYMVIVAIRTTWSSVCVLIDRNT
jgi:hypothetical protein